MTTGREIVEAEYREVSPVVNGGVGGANAAPFLPFDFWKPIPIPSEWTRVVKTKNPETGEEVEEEVPYFVKRDALSRKTPRTQKKIHAKGFPYVEIDFVRNRLNEAFDHGRWTFLITKREQGRQYTTSGRSNKTYVEVMVGGWLLAPGILPTYGEGSAPWAQDDQGDPRFMLSTAWNSAESIALKSAAKKLGIGADVKEDEAGDPVLEGQRKSCVKMFEDLVKNDKEEKAIKAVKKHAPMALTSDNKLNVEAISEDVVDDLLEALTNAYI